VAINHLPEREQADIDLQKISFDRIETALKSFKLDLKRWPTEDEGLQALVSADALEDDAEQAKWGGPYLEDPVFEDAWGTELVYRYPSEVRDGDYYDLVSYGPDREEGNDDITNHDDLLDENGDMREGLDDFSDLAQ